MLKGVITTLFAGKLQLCTYCGKAGHIHQDCRQWQHQELWEYQRRDTPYPERPYRGWGIEYESSPQREEEYPKWMPPASGFDILNRDQPPTTVRPTRASTQTIHKQVHTKEELEISPPKREPKCSFCREETHLLPDLPGTEADSHRTGRWTNTLASGWVWKISGRGH